MHVRAVNIPNSMQSVPITSRSGRTLSAQDIRTYEPSECRVLSKLFLSNMLSKVVVWVGRRGLFDMSLFRQKKY